MAPRTRGAVKLELASFYDSRGFCGLPTELLLQIVSYSQQAVIPWIHEHMMGHRYSERRDLLRTLCQLCRSLRVIFLPLLWERLEACVVDVMHRSSLAKDLLWQLKLVMDRKLRYAPYVRVVSVTVLTFEDTILKKLARALSLMSNVHTVQIVCHGIITNDTASLTEAHQFWTAFEGYIYPSVRHVVVPHHAGSIFSCFPQAHHVHINQQSDSNVHDSIAGVAKYCHAVESFGWVEDRWEPSISLIVTTLPHLRRLEYHITDGDLVEVMELSKLQNLEQIKLSFASCLEGCDETTQIIEDARSVLAKSQASQRNKRLIVVYAADDYSAPPSTCKYIVQRY